MLRRPLRHGSKASGALSFAGVRGRWSACNGAHPMPRYFFHVHDGYSSIDEEGTVLSSLQAAREEAVQAAAGILRDSGQKLWTGEPWRLEVTDMAGNLLFTLHFS